MREPSNIKNVLSLQPEFMGFIFYEKSPRFVEEFPSDINFGSTKKIGVFVNETIENITKAIANYKLDGVQLHGDERPEFCAQLINECFVIKAFGIANANDLEQVGEYEGFIDFALFDTKSAQRGGTGKQFDWSILNAYQGKTPFLLSGGISPDDVEALQQISHPRFVGVDVNSRFELEPAVKHVEQLQQFIQDFK